MQFKDDVDTGSGRFIKLKDQEKIIGVFRGEIHDFRHHWFKVEGKADESEICTGPGCVRCKKKPGSFRFRVNFVTKVKNEYTVKLFEQGAKFYEMLRSLHKNGYDLEKTVLTITRSGTDRNTVYSILPVPGMSGVVSEAQEKLLKALPLHDLVNLGQGEGSPHPREEGNPSYEDQDIPF